MSPAETINRVSLFYHPELMIGDVTSEQRTMCLGILQKVGFQCVVGCAGAPEAIISDLAQEAERDRVGSARNDSAKQFFIGPDPAIELGVGIWTAAKQPTR